MTTRRRPVEVKPKSSMRQTSTLGSLPNPAKGTRDNPLAELYERTVAKERPAIKSQTQLQQEKQKADAKPQDLAEEQELAPDDIEKPQEEQIQSEPPVAKPAKKQTHVWKTTGAYFGYIEGDNLWTKGGKHAGKVVNGEIYDFKGHYIGELMGTDCLIADKRKKRLNKRVGHSFPVLPSRAAISSLGNRSSSTVKFDYEEFKLES